MSKFVILLSIVSVGCLVTAMRECVSRMPARVVTGTSVLCVCNSTYCDDAPGVFRGEGDSDYSIVTSSKSGLRFNKTLGKFTKSPVPTRIFRRSNVIRIDNAKRYQEMLGFGGSLTDSVGVNLLSLSEGAREELLKTHFAPTGVEYSLVRISMGASDFSPRVYSHAEVESDVNLVNFTLVEEDLVHKIPFMRRAAELSDEPIKFMASPWSAPLWMKTVKSWVGITALKREYWHAWATYFIKFFRAYRDEGVEFWGLTPQNEPALGLIGMIPIMCMGWTASDQRDWVRDFLAPSLQHAGFENMSIIIADGQRHLLPLWPQIIMGDPGTRKVVAGTAVHWYLDAVVRPELLDITRALFPDKYILYTESSASFLGSAADIASWKTAEQYAANIFETISHWVVGWVDWNIALDLKGGPNWMKNYRDAPVIVNATADEFYKQPTFYVMGHFSKYVRAGSVRIAATTSGPNNIPVVAFKRPDNATVLVLQNTYASPFDVFITDPTAGNIQVTLPAKSIHSLVYW